MRITCLHGYFKFQDDRAGEVSKFASRYGLDLEPVDDYYTFAGLVGAPDFALAGKTYLDAVTTKTFAGKPWEVMRANGLVFNFALGTVVPIATITTISKIDQVGNYYFSPGLILPGSLTDEGSRVTDYAAWFSFESLRFKYSSIDTLLAADAVGGTKVLDATANASGVVTAEGQTVPAAEVLSEGKQASAGVLLIEGEKARYLPSSATDIKTTIEKTVAVIDDVVASLNKLVTVLTAVGAGMTGPTTAPPPTLAADLAVITAKVATLNTTKADLNTLKGALK